MGSSPLAQAAPECNRHDDVVGNQLCAVATRNKCVIGSGVSERRHSFLKKSGYCS